MNAGWCDIARKIEEFTECPKIQDMAGTSRLTDINYPYAKAVRDNKWHSKKIGEAELGGIKGVIELSVKSGDQETELLNRCLVGGLEDENRERHTSSEIRR